MTVPRNAIGQMYEIYTGKELKVVLLNACQKNSDTYVIFMWICKFFIPYKINKFYNNKY